MWAEPRLSGRNESLPRSSGRGGRKRTPGRLGCGGLEGWLNKGVQAIWGPRQRLVQSDCGVRVWRVDKLGMEGTAPRTRLSPYVFEELLPQRWAVELQALFWLLASSHFTLRCRSRGIRRFSAVPLTRSVTLGRLPYFPEPRFLHLESGGRDTCHTRQL